MKRTPKQEVSPPGPVCDYSYGCALLQQHGLELLNDDRNDRDCAMSHILSISAAWVLVNAQTVAEALEIVASLREISVVLCGT